MKEKLKSTNCPYCESPMIPLVMGCRSCDVEIKGSFPRNHFSDMEPEDLELLEQYLLAEFSIKAMAEQTGMGYVAIRNRLDKLISNYKKFASVENARKKILMKLEQGEITADQAAVELERLK